MDKNQDPGSGINIPAPQHWWKTMKVVGGCIISGSGIRDKHPGSATLVKTIKVMDGKKL
jgi:hypothetical protein